MKKVLTFILAFVLMLTLGACSQNGEQSATRTDQDRYAGTFRAGFGEALINPKESVPLAGYGNTSKRMSQNIVEDLYIQCVALTDEQDNTVLIYAADAIRTDENMILGMENVAKTLNIPTENIMLNCSHSHSSPDGQNSAEPSILRHNEYVREQMLVAARRAMEDRKTAQMFYGSAETEGLNFIRHYVMDDGSYGGDSFGDWDNHYAVEHTAQPDTTMHVLKFTRDGSKDIVIVNWRAHAAMTGGAGKALNVSSDFLGPFRDSLEKMAGCHAMYLQGHAGNINPGSRISEEVLYSDYREHGAKLAGYAFEALQNMKQLETGHIQAKQQLMEGNIDHSMDHLQVKASELSAIWSNTNDRELVIEQGKPFGIRSPYHANAIKNNAKRDKTEELLISTISIGNSVALAAGPGELFDRNSMAVEDASPFEVTLCLSYTNDHKGYIPADYVWEYTSYETDTTRFERGTAEQIQQTMIRLLEQLSNG